MSFNKKVHRTLLSQARMQVQGFSASYSKFIERIRNLVEDTGTFFELKFVLKIQMPALRITVMGKMVG